MIDFNNWCLLKDKMTFSFKIFYNIYNNKYYLFINNDNNYYILYDIQYNYNRNYHNLSKYDLIDNDIHYISYKTPIGYLLFNKENILSYININNININFIYSLTNKKLQFNNLLNILNISHIYI